jgi:hypothetical protein
MEQPTTGCPLMKDEYCGAHAELWFSLKSYKDI